ncbi:MAG: DEAD/DEAH box helicase [Vicinamibacterales bacterium]
MPFHPLVSHWFSSRFRSATEAQTQAWPALAAGDDVLISAPTGSGKTLAAFLLCLDRLVRAGLDGSLDDRIEVVYVSPLKALGNDIQKNLEEPLAEISALAAEQGLSLPPIRVAVRTGDTPASERQRMLRRPPHILVTTPESLFILLTAEKSRAALRTTRTVIVDEIHAVVDDKRGAHLALSLARFDDLVTKGGGPAPQRIGLSATVRPIESVARFLSARPVRIIDTGHRRTLDLAVEVPKDELGAVATNEMWDEIYDRLATLIEAHRTTLVFVNTRRLAERVTHHMAERLGESAVLAHHGSLSRRLRLDAEQRLKRGDLRAVVATASLELGIDIGSVDLVCQIGSPRSIAVALQRVGRSGHQADPASIPKGRIFATTRDELVECAALVRAIRSGSLDRLEFPSWPLDVLCQQIVAAAACEAWREDDLFALVRGADPYRELPRRDFDAVVAMLAEGIATGRGRRGAYLHRDEVNGVVRGRRGARLAAITSGGAIPDNAQYFVVAEPEGAIVGTLDEDFAVESLAGDVFLLGSNSWRIRRIEAGRVRVEDAHGAAPSIPFWRGEAPGRTVELSDEVSNVRQAIASEPDPTTWLVQECGLDARGAEQAVLYVRAGAAALGALPTKRRIVAERFFDEGGGMQLVIHAPFGARINRAWGLSLRKRFCRTFNFELQAAATDNGIVISLAEQHSFPLETVFWYVRPPTVEAVLKQALLDSPMFEARWRWNATRALAILRFAGGRKVPPPIQRMRSADLLASVFPDQAACGENIVGDIRIPDHPLVNETIRDCLTDAMDLERLKALLIALDAGEIEAVAIDTAEPSPFSHEILNANPYAYLDDAPLEERRARAVQMRRTLGNDAGDIGALDPAAIEEVHDESWPVVRDAEELHDALLTLIVLPPAAEWCGFVEALARSSRATMVRAGEASFWVAAERLATATCLYPESRLDPAIASVERSPAASREAAAIEAVRGWLESTGPTTAAALAARLALPREIVEGALLALESEGQILRGRFTLSARGADADLEWCNRRLLARIHRLTLGRLRREIEPVTAADFMRFLCTWQHLAPGTQLHGVDGVLKIVEQLQGYEVSAGAWESEVLRRRVADYTTDLLDRLCLSGEVMWGRLSPHPSFAVEVSANDADVPAHSAGPRVRPTRVAPVAIFLREDAGWLLDPVAAAERNAHPSVLSHAALAIAETLEKRGASFLPALAKATGLLMSQVEDALWELVAAGAVTADGFDNLRALVDPKRRRGEGRGRHQRPRHSAGRWTLLRPDTTDAPPVPPADLERTRAEKFARQLLARWGVVFRDLMARETLAPAWRDLLMALRRLEARGEIRGGRFVSGFLGEQFALPEAVDLLRVVRRAASSLSIGVVSADPLNLAGIITPGPRISPAASQMVPIVSPSSLTTGVGDVAGESARMRNRE